MLIAVEGCAHGELEKIYDCIQLLETKNNVKVDLLICCGDFQSVRNPNDLCCMAIPMKYYDMCSFYKYYTGQKVAPILTIFIGGNHEASNYLQELPYGGWVAPNIYFLGQAGVINVAGVRIGGLSGIYKGHDYLKGHFEISPYTDDTKRSVYHIRNLEVFRLRQLSGEMHILLSHDWPRNAADHGNVEKLLRAKPFFREEIDQHRLGSAPAEDLLNSLKPQHWFAGHLHCHYAALVPHPNSDTHTRFLALDKCLPKRKFLQVVTVAHDESLPIKLQYDLEWLAVLKLTNHLLNVRPTANHMPGEYTQERFNFTPTEEEKQEVLKALDNNLVIPENFVTTAEPYNPEVGLSGNKRQPQPVLNPQTGLLCEILQIDDPVSLVLQQEGRELPLPAPISKPVNKDWIMLTPESAAQKTFTDLLPDTPIPSFRPMALPNPTINFSDDDDDDGDEKVQSVGAERPASKSQEEEEVVMEKTMPEYCSTPLSSKKPFKRRNESLYSNNGDE